MNFACPSQEIVQQMQNLLTTMADMKREICDLRSQLEVKDAKRPRVSEEVPPFPSMDESDLLDFFEHGLQYIVNKKVWPIKLVKSNKLLMYENEECPTCHKLLTAIAAQPRYNSKGLITGVYIMCQPCGHRQEPCEIKEYEQCQ